MDDEEIPRSVLEARLSYYQNRALDGEQRLAAAEARCAEIRGAMDADDRRLREAAIRVWGEDRHGCDTPDEMAELILTLRARCARADAAADCYLNAMEREQDAKLVAEAERDRYRATAERRWAMRDELEQALGVADTYGEDQWEKGMARVRELLAAEADRTRLREALREISLHPCWLTKMGYTMTCESAKAVGACGPCRARAALAASEVKEVGR
jgi:hypothetical protein